MEVRTLWPLSRGEMTGRKESLLEALFAEKPVMVRAHNHENTARDIIAGGYPEALSRLDAARRDAWFAAYVSAILQRDVRDLARIEGLIDLPRLLALLAARSSGLMNMAEISRSAAIPHTTLKRYLTLLELTFLLQPLAAWSTNLGKRLVKSPKVHLVDSGLAAHLCGVDEERLQRDRMLFGQLLETFVVMELRKQVSWDARRIGLYHFRSTTGREVDAVLEGPGGRVVGIEVKASATIGNADFAGLEALAEVAGHRFLRGILLYDGSKALPFGDRFMAAPVSSLWAEWTAQ
jgi:predicted AAA+ superfamily ATPase